MSIYITGDTHGAKKFGFYSIDGFLPRFNTDNFPEQKEMDFALKNLELHGNKVDYIFTHDGPASAKVSLGYEADAFSCYLEKIREQTSYGEWFFGHLHDNRAVEGGKEFLLYEQIIRIG